MKPNFALDFRNDAITLLHRTPRGWQTVGTVGLDAEDMAAELSYLRTTALELSPKGMTTKLVIPNAQILYTRVPVTAPDTARRRKQVARGLEGVTPYAVADLAFDFAGSGDAVEVAVIAKETLAEAEAFATEHRFNPVSFVAVPDAAGFDGEPWFGTTNVAASHLSEGQRVDRDSTPIVVLGRDHPAMDSAGPGDAAAEAMPAADLAADAADDQPEPVADMAPAEPLTADAKPEPAAPARSDLTEPAQDAAFATELEVKAGPATEPEPESVIAGIDSAEASQVAPTTDAVADPEIPASQPLPDAPIADVSIADASTADAGPARSAQEMAAPARAEDTLNTAMPAPTIALANPAPEAPVDDEAPMALDVVDDLPEAPQNPAPQTPAPQTPAQMPRAGVLNPSIPDDDLPPPPAASIMVAFGSRRALEASAKEAAAKAGSPKALAARPGIAKPPTLGGISATRTGPNAKVTTLSPRPSQPSVVRLPPRPSQLVSVIGDGARELAKEASKPPLKPPAKSGVAGKALRGLGALVTQPSIAGAKERRPTVPPVVQMVTPPTGPNSAASAAAATLTKAGTKPYSGGLGSRSMERTKPRYLGLILTGILVVFLVLVAAWSTLFLESRNTTTPDAAAVVDAAPAGDAALPEGDAVASLDGAAVDPEMLADLQGPAADDPAAQDPAAEVSTGEDPATGDLAPDAQVIQGAGPQDAQVPADAPIDPVADAVAAEVAQAVTDPPATNPPATEPPATDPPVELSQAPELDTQAAEAIPVEDGPQDEFLLATVDEPPAMPDALSLPQPLARNDTPPAPAVPPPPFGTVYQFGADGLIVPQPEGIMTPEGVMLFAGRPPVAPPQRPASLAPAEAAAEPAAAPPTGGVASGGSLAEAAPVFADPALAGARPRPRPADLAPQTQPGTTQPETRNADDDASLAPEASSRFASLRPRAKPAALTETAALTEAAANPPVNPPANPIADLGAQAASLTAQAAALAAANPDISPLALSVSRKPAPRPNDLVRQVEEAVTVAARQPDPKPQVQVQEPAVQTAPEADNEPEIASAMPRLPTKTTVAKQATYVNAINLSKMNLIGVFGSSSDRYALIRQPNGRLKKVSVGDSFDGGRVAAITSSEVRYQKSGKIVTLALPKG